MRRLSKSLTALGVAALVIAGGSAYAVASSNSTITVCVKHRGGALYKAKACAKHDKQLSWDTRGPQGATGPQGPKGDAGAAGVQGATGVQGVAGAPAAVAVAGWSGAIGTIGTSSGLVFAGPQATVTTTAGDPTIVASGSASLGTNTGSAHGYVAICYQAATGGTLHYLDNNSGNAAEGVTPSTNSMVAGVSQTGAPGSGTWNLGVCVDDLSSTQAWNANDWSIGWAMVTAGTPTSE
jgi:hypothetical protein